MEYIRLVSAHVGWSCGVLVLHMLGRINRSKLSSDERLELMNLVKDHRELLHTAELGKEAEKRGLVSTISYL